MKKMFSVIFLTIFVACAQSSSQGVVVPEEQPAAVDPDSEIVEQILQTPVKDRNGEIRKVVLSGKLQKARSYAVLAQNVRRILLPRYNPAGTFQILSEGFAALPASELSADNIDLYLAELKPGYKTRAAALLIESGKLDTMAHARAMYYYDDLDREPLAEK